MFPSFFSLYCGFYNKSDFFQNSDVDLRHVTAERKRDLNGISNGKYLMRRETPILAIWLGGVTFSILH